MTDSLQLHVSNLLYLYLDLQLELQLVVSFQHPNMNSQN